MSIHKTAIIGENAKLGKNVQIGPYALIEDGVITGDNVQIAAHAIIREGTILGNNVFVDSFAALGGLPQDRKFESSIKSGVKIGDNVMIREGVTVHRSTEEGSFTEVGEETLLMANSHVAHDCKVGKHVNLANGVLLGGRVCIDDFCFLGGNAVVHQHLRIGNGCIVGGRAGLNLDIPPFLMVSEHNEVHGLNKIGLRRRGFSQEEIGELKECLVQVYSEPGNPYKRALSARGNGLGKTEPANIFLTFFENKGPKGCIHSRHFMHKCHA